jgi:hypothetical protein
MVLTRDALRHAVRDGAFPLLPKKTTFIAQVLITFMMALCMSGTMGFISAGPDFLAHWPQSFIIAWPIAFLFTQVVTPLAFKIALKVAPPH